jgi:hypothetical protein
MEPRFLGLNGAKSRLEFFRNDGMIGCENLPAARRYSVQLLRSNQVLEASNPLNLGQLGISHLVGPKVPEISRRR